MHILIIEDEEQLCRSIAEGLRMDGYETDTCLDGDEGLELCTTENYDLILLDLNLPGIDGLDILRQFRETNSSTPVLILSARGQIEDKVEGLDLGANDYLTKPFDMDELIARIVSLIRRYTRFNQQEDIQQLTFEGLKIDIDNRCITTENGIFELPPKEFDLLLFCAKNQGKILTKQQIYESVWGEEYVYDDSNIMAIISRLRKKLEVTPGKPKYIQTIKGIGYRFNKEV